MDQLRARHADQEQGNGELCDRGVADPEDVLQARQRRDDDMHRQRRHRRGHDDDGENAEGAGCAVVRPAAHFPDVTGLPGGIGVPDSLGWQRAYWYG